MATQNKQIELIELGLTSYKRALAIQEDLFNKIILVKRANRQNTIQESTKNYLLWVEHSPVFTIGKSGKQEHLLFDKEDLKQKEIEFYATNRGGDITFHGPGQIVGYPILDLDNFFTDIHKYLRLLEETVILTLQDYGIKGARTIGQTGVWLEAETPFARKICALGVRASRWVTMHGFALNVNTDLSYFEGIIPCGIQGKGVTSMKKELGAKISIEEVKTKLKHYFSILFKAKLKEGYI